MVNVIIVSDDLDAMIGTNCTLSHQNFENEVDLNAANVIVLNGNLSTADEVQTAIGSFDGRRFILVAYSHGNPAALVSSVAADGYIHSANSYFFSESLIYTNSCYSGTTLKNNLIAAGCGGYVGYTDEVRLPENEEDDILFINCENSGLIHFLNSGDSLSASIKVMIQKYNDQYNAFVANNMNVAAAFLLHNLRCLTFYENGTIDRSIYEN